MEFFTKNTTCFSKFYNVESVDTKFGFEEFSIDKVEKLNNYLISGRLNDEQRSCVVSKLQSLRFSELKKHESIVFAYDCITEGLGSYK